MSPSTIDIVEGRVVALSRAQQAVVDLLDRSPQAILGTVAEVGRQAGVDASTVVRLAIRLGYSGWTEMQQVHRSQWLAGLNATETRQAHAASADGTPFERSLLQDLTNVRSVMEAIPHELVETVAEVLGRSNRIVVAASGSFIGPAVVLAHLGAVVGLPIQLEDRSGVNLGGVVAHLAPGDCLFAVNLWRQTSDLVAASRLAKSNGATVIGLVDTRTGVAANSDHVLLVPSESASFFQSTTAALAVVYGLISELTARMGGRASDGISRSQSAWDAMGSLGPLRS